MVLSNQKMRHGDESVLPMTVRYDADKHSIGMPRVLNFSSQNSRWTLTPRASVWIQFHQHAWSFLGTALSRSGGTSSARAQPQMQFLRAHSG